MNNKNSTTLFYNLFITTLVLFLLFLFIHYIKNRPSFHSAEVESDTKGQVETLCIRQSLGIFEVTGYCSCSMCCGDYADGVTASGYIIQKGDKFCAADPLIPFGKVLDIKGYGIVSVLDRDRGGSIKDKKLDVYFDTHEEALKWGRQKIEIFCWVKQECIFHTNIKKISISITGMIITLEDGSSVDDLYTGMKVHICSVKDSQKYSVGLILDYAGNSKTMEVRIQYTSDVFWNPNIGDEVKITID